MFSTTIDLQNIVCEVLPKITNWFHANRPSLNATKTFYQLFSNTVTDNLDIFIDKSRGVVLYLFVGADASTILICAPSILDMHPQ